MAYVYIGVMAAVTYLIRVIPLTVFRRKIENRYIRSFLYYVPYTCLTAMTFPAILYATESVVSALAGVAAAAIFAFRDKSLVEEAAAAYQAAGLVEDVRISWPKRPETCQILQNFFEIPHFLCYH